MDKILFSVKKKKTENVKKLTPMLRVNATTACLVAL